MENLINKKCVPCQGGIPPLAEEEIKKYMSQLQGNGNWEALDGKKLHKVFKFKDFKEAVTFVNKIADLAEQEQHHPNISIDYSKVDVEIWTHKIGGLHENDFILASKIDNL